MLPVSTDLDTLALFVRPQVKSLEVREHLKARHVLWLWLEIGQ